MTEDKLPTQSENFAEWYNQLVLKAELADYAPVRGCMVVRPYGWAVWENMTAALDRRFKATGHVNAAFPLLIPMSFFEKEKSHVEGFSPELAVVTIGGGEKLEEPLVVRPTSETIIGTMYAKWIKSYRDLPVLINQWGSVVRWEMRTKLFLRTLEFYWQEGHTAHATPEEGQEETLRMLDVYADFAIEDGAIPVVKGRKSQAEKFAGADNSYSIEAMMGDTKALQAGTSHNLGQNFAKAFDIQYLDKNNLLQYVWTTSWGLSTRFVGAVIMTHGDDQGLILPPKLAPYQIVIIPIYKNDEEKVPRHAGGLQEWSRSCRASALRSTTVKKSLLASSSTIGRCAACHCASRSVPRMSKKARWHLPGGICPAKPARPLSSTTQLEAQVAEALQSIQASMFERALAFRRAHTFDPKDYDELKSAVEKGWAFSWWCGDPECETKVKDETKASTRCIPLDQEPGQGTCIVCGKPATEKVIFGRAY